MTRLLPDGGVEPPAVPSDRLDAGGWERTDATVQTLFDLGSASVRGHTEVYQDRPLRDRVRAATGGDVDRTWRFFFATRLTFTPPLPPGVGPPMVEPTVRSEAFRRFADDLADRGFTDIERGRRERVRTRGGDRAHLQQFTACLPLPDLDRTLDVEGWVGVWSTPTLYVAGGAYPATSLATLLDEAERAAADEETLSALDRGREAFRSDLLDLVRNVG